MLTELVVEFSDLLEKERKALLSADFDTLSELTHEKEALLEKLKSADPVELSRLKERSDRNQKLLQAAMAGLRNGSKHLSPPKAQEFKTYSADGSINRPHAKVTLERKA